MFGMSCLQWKGWWTQDGWPAAFLAALQTGVDRCQSLLMSCNRPKQKNNQSCNVADPDPLGSKLLTKPHRDPWSPYKSDPDSTYYSISRLWEKNAFKNVPSSIATKKVRCVQKIYPEDPDPQTTWKVGSGWFLSWQVGYVFENIVPDPQHCILEAQKRLHLNTWSQIRNGFFTFTRVKSGSEHHVFLGKKHAWKLRLSFDELYTNLFNREEYLIRVSGNSVKDTTKCPKSEPRVMLIFVILISRVPDP